MATPTPNPNPNPTTQVYLPVAEAAVGSLDYLGVHARHGAQRSRDPPTWLGLELANPNPNPNPNQARSAAASHPPGAPWF